MELKVGFMTVEQLAEWAGRKPSSLSNNKKRWCENNLQYYAKYELVRGGVKILEVINPYFTTSGRQEVRQKYLSYYGHDGIKADTARNCWEKMKPHIKADIADNSGISYTGEARREDFGTVKGNKRKGKKGSSRFVFGKIVNGEFYYFTEEEEAIKKELCKKYFHDVKVEYIEEQQALNWALKHKEITVEEYAESMQALLDKDVNWIDFQIALDDALGCETGFRVLIEEHAWSPLSEEEFDF